MQMCVISTARTDSPSSPFAVKELKMSNPEHQNDMQDLLRPDVSFGAQSVYVRIRHALIGKLMTEKDPNP